MIRPMLSNDDLTKIRKVIREEVKTEVKDSTRTLDNQIRMSRMRIQEDISDLDDRMKNVEVRVDEVTHDVKDTKTRVKKIEKTVDVIVKLFDEEDVKLAKRLSRVEEHLGLSSKN